MANITLSAPTMRMAKSRVSFEWTPLVVIAMFVRIYSLGSFLRTGLMEAVELKFWLIEKRWSIR